MVLNELFAQVSSLQAFLQVGKAEPREGKGLIKGILQISVKRPRPKTIGSTFSSFSVIPLHLFLSKELQGFSDFPP